jgi:hypothetical protein
MLTPNHRRHRGPGRFRFTYHDVSRVCGLALDTVRSDLRLSSDVETVATYVARAVAQRSVKLSDEAAAQTFGCRLADWRARWPRFDVYRCGSPNCESVLLEPGLCGGHGGSVRPFAAVQDDHLVLYLNRSYVPICHVVFGTGAKLGVRHIDGNTWNNHPENLEVVENPTRASRRRRWSYGYHELSDLFGLSEDGTRQAASRGLFNPASLDSVTSFWWLRQERKR